MRKTNDNKNHKKQNNKIQPFDEFSLYASDEKLIVTLLVMKKIFFEIIIRK